MKRVFALLICMVMLLSFAGCADDGKTNEVSANESTAGQSNVAETTNEETAGENPLPADGHIAAVGTAEEPLRIICLYYKNNPFWLGIENGAIEAQQYLADYNCTVDPVVMAGDIKADSCISAIETAITQGYDGIVVSSLSDGTEVIINRAVENGIAVITMCGESTVASDRLALSGTDPVKFAELQAQATIDYLQAKGIENAKVANITGYFSVATHETNRKAYIDYMAEHAPDVEVIGSWEGKDSADTTYDLTKNIITANPDIDVIYCNAGGPYGAAKAIQDLDLTGKVGVVASDWIEENLQYVKTGEIVALEDQNPTGMCLDACVYLFNYLAAGVVPPEFIPSQTPIVTPETYDEVIGK